MTDTSRRARDERGSLILDVLIGISIFALIAIIAVSAINQYRARAYEQAAVSDARQIGIALELAYDTTTGWAAYYSDSGGGWRLDPDALGVNMTRGNRVGAYEFYGDSSWAPTGQPVYVGTENNGFYICVEKVDGDGSGRAFAEYDSASGGITRSGRGRGC